jgi:DNA-binding Lrp family transcriptional regulator
MAVAQPSFATIRLVNRLAIPCVLDAVMVGRLERDFLDALILLAVVQANVAPISRDPELQRAYGAYDDPPPDELRRPVSINAIAHSLRLPYETVRRRIVKLARAGACDAGPQGVIVPARELASPQHLAAMIAVWEQIRRLYCRLRDLGLLDDVIRAEDRERWASNAADPPMRAVIRVASDYMLRLVDNLTRRFGSLIAGVVWSAILRANTEQLPESEYGTPGETAGDFVDDARRTPVRIAALAQRLGAPPETIRRYAAELVEAGQCVRTRQGFIVPAEVLARPNAVNSMRDNFMDLRRMFAAFAQLGVLAEWDRLNPPLRGAA